MFPSDVEGLILLVRVGPCWFGRCRKYTSAVTSLEFGWVQFAVEVNNEGVQLSVDGNMREEV